MSLDELPEAIGLRPVRRAFVQEDGCTVCKWTVHNVTVTRDPTYVGGAEVHIIVAHVEHHLRGRCNLREIPSGGV
jgi:hypothetical protein